MRRPYFANDLIDVALSGEIVVTLPCERRSGGRVLLFAFPQMAPVAVAGTRHQNVTYVNDAWFVNDALASTLPVRCCSQAVAQQLADVWVDAVVHESVDPSIGDQVEKWCYWWTQNHPGQATFAPLNERLRVHPANTLPESPVAGELVEWPADTTVMASITDDTAPPAPAQEESA